VLVSGVVQEQDVALPLLGLVEQWLELFVVVLPLGHWVCLCGHLACLPGLHAQAVEELPDTPKAAPDADELFDAPRSLLDAAGRVLPQGGLHPCAVPVQLALWLVVVQQP
jgi:hypothetical protein